MELQGSLPDLAGQGIVPLAVSCDEPAVLAAFARDHGIEYALLSDRRSEVIRRYGILNPELAPGDEHYGIPVPGSYLVGSDGRVEQKLFHRSHRVREAGPALVRRVGGRATPGAWPSASVSSGEVSVSAALEAPGLRVGQVADVVVRLAPAPGLHLYGRPVPEGLHPTTVTVTSTPPLEVAPARYPPTEPHYVRGLGMELPAYAGAVEVVVPLLPERAEGTFAIEVGVRYQACSESECLLPRSERLLLEAPAGILVPGRGRPA